MPSKDDLLDAALNHALFDGWSDATLEAARVDLEMSKAAAQAAFPRGAVDMALAYHQRGNRQMVELLEEEDLTTRRYRDRIAYAVRLRLEIADKELVRRGMALYALPQHAAIGSRALWETSDAIWTALGDTSRDVNWYTKRATLSAVYSSTVLYWLGDETTDNQATWDFLDRRIENVMQFEKLKAKAKGNPLIDKFMKGPGRVLDLVHAPGGRWHAHGPGHPPRRARPGERR